MKDNKYFETKRFWTNEKIKIPLNEILSIDSRSLNPWEIADHARILINGINTEQGIQPNPLLDKEWLLLISLDDAEEIQKLLKNFELN